MRKIILIISILITIIATLLFSCRGCFKEKQTLESKETNLVFLIENNSANLDPRIATSSIDIKIGQLIYSSIAEYDENLNVIPSLAERIETPDPETYIIHLRDGVKFHNGRGLTSEDVKYTFESVLDPATASPHKALFEKVKEITIDGKYKLTVKLTEPFAPFLLSLTFGIVPKEEAEKAGKDFYKNPIGSGPFKYLNTTGDGNVILARNDNYYGQKAKLDKITFKYVPDVTVRMLELMKKSAHIAHHNIPINLLAELAEKDWISVEYTQGIGCAYLGFNLKDPILSKINVRKAVAYAINRESIIKNKLLGRAKNSTGLLSSLSWAYNNDVPKYEFNPEKAEELLDNAGLKDPDKDGPKKRFTLTYKTSTDKSKIDMAKVLISDLETVGIGVDLRTYEFGIFYNDIKTGNFQIFSLSWPAIPDPDLFQYIFHSKSIPPNGANRGFYSNSEIDNLIDTARKSININERKDHYKKIQSILADELPYIFLWHEDYTLAINKSVKGYKIHPVGSFIHLKDAWIE